MKALTQKLPLEGNTSFVAWTYRTPNFEVPWHQHIEYELILLTEGSGLCFVGNYVGEFEAGDVFFIGADVTHTFQKREKDLTTSAVVIQFREDFRGKDFMWLPENKALRELFDFSAQGMRIKGQSKIKLQPLIRDLEYLNGFHRIIHLFKYLQVLLNCDGYETLSTQWIKLSNGRDKEGIENMFHYTMDSFHEDITLVDIAKVAGMSIPVFCNNFKKSTKGLILIPRTRSGSALPANCSLILTRLCSTSAMKAVIINS